MHNNDLQTNDAEQPNLHKADVMRRFLAELKSAVEQGKDYDYTFNGEDEIRVDYFDSDEAVKSVVELLTKFGMLPNGA